MNNFHLSELSNSLTSVAHCAGEPPCSSAWSDPSKMIHGIKSSTYWFNASAYGHLPDLDKDKNVNYILGGIAPRIWSGREVDLGAVTLNYQTTAIMAIEVAIYMGFNKIKLIGFDHDWLANPDYSRHFYSDKKSNDDTLGELEYRVVLDFVAKMWDSYYALLDTSRKYDISIVNETENSFLDVFKKNN